jgi:hypothetical protein
MLPRIHSSATVYLAETGREQVKVIPLGNDHELIRRLATGVIAEWPKLPAEIKSAILSQACQAMDPASQRTSLVQDLKEFIKRNQELKGAQEFVEDLVRAVRPLKTTAIVLREDEARPGYDFNWIVSTGPLPPDAKTRFEQAIIDMRRQYPRVDWEGITEHESDWRVVQRWVSDE